MWEDRCGALPVVDDNGRVISMITDRDISIALGTRNLRASDVHVNEVRTAAGFHLRGHRRYFSRARDHGGAECAAEACRLPTMKGKLVGVISIDDFLLHTEPGQAGILSLEALEALKTIVENRKRNRPHDSTQALVARTHRDAILLARINVDDSSRSHGSVSGWIGTRTAVARPAASEPEREVGTGLQLVEFLSPGTLHRHSRCDEGHGVHRDSPHPVSSDPQNLRDYRGADANRSVEARLPDRHHILQRADARSGAALREVVESAKTAMTFLKDFGANHLVVFPPNRSNGTGEPAFKAMCESFNEIGTAAREMGFYAGLHNHMGEMVQTEEEIDRCMALTAPKLFYFSPDTAHLHLAGCDVVKTLEKHKHRLMMADYKDAKKLASTKPDSFDKESIFDLGDGDIDFPGCHRVLKSIDFKGWLIVDLDIARKGPRASYVRSADYVVNRLESVYA